MPNKNLKILCVCQKGCARSVGTRYRLNRRGFLNVIAIGHETTSPETITMLIDWADLILLSEPKMEDLLFGPANTGREKVENRFTIGRDRWGYFRHAEMQEIIKRQLNALGLR